MTETSSRNTVRDRNTGQTDLARVTAERDDLRARLTTGIGLPLGVNDRDGNPVHVGDTLAFDGREWTRTYGAPDHIYTVEYSGGQVLVDGTIGDIRHYCRVVKRWDAPKESP